MFLQNRRFLRSSGASPPAVSVLRSRQRSGTKLAIPPTASSETQSEPPERKEAEGERKEKRGVSYESSPAVACDKMKTPRKVFFQNRFLFIKK